MLHGFICDSGPQPHFSQKLFDSGLPGAEVSGDAPLGLHRLLDTHCRNGVSRNVTVRLLGDCSVLWSDQRLRFSQLSICTSRRTISEALASVSPARLCAPSSPGTLEEPEPPRQPVLRQATPAAQGGLGTHRVWHAGILWDVAWFPQTARKGRR